MADHDIGSRPVWKPMHLQSVYVALPIMDTGGSAAIFATSLCLPSGPTMTDSQQNRVVDIVVRILTEGTADIT